jgi:hypothetical protein
LSISRNRGARLAQEAPGHKFARRSDEVLSLTLGVGSFPGRSSWIRQLNGHHPAGEPSHERDRQGSQTLASNTKRSPKPPDPGSPPRLERLPTGIGRFQLGLQVLQMCPDRGDLLAGSLIERRIGQARVQLGLRRLQGLDPSR